MPPLRPTAPEKTLPDIANAPAPPHCPVAMLSASPASLAASLVPAVREAARQAGALAMAQFRAGTQTAARVWFKQGSSPVTEADIAVDALLNRRLGDLLPEAAWLSEETTDDAVRLDKR